MKKLFLGMMLLAGLAACNNKTSATQQDVSDAPFDSLTIDVDSMAVSMTLKVIGSPADGQMRASLAQFVGEQMFFNEDDEGNILKPAYDGNLRAFLQACAQQKWDELRQDTYPGGEADEEDGDSPTPEELAAGMTDEDGEQMYLTTYAITFSKVYETDDHVTWQANWDFYVNATAGPNLGATGVTLRKADGKPLGHDLLKDTDSAGFGQLLKEAARQWVVGVLEEKADNDGQLKKYLYGECDVNHLPLPEHAPFLTAEGVVLPYEASELFFTHEPQLLVLPYEQVKPYLK